MVNNKNGRSVPNNSMKQIIIALLFIFASVQAFSQRSINFGIIYGQRLNYRTPPFNSVTGISVEYKLSMETKIEFRLSAGIEGTSPTVSNGVDSYKDDFVVIPIRVGIQPYIYEDKGFLFVESGLLTIKTFPFDELGRDNLRLGFSLALGVGYRFPLNQRKYIQTSLSYNYIPNSNFYNFSWINIRLAYGLKWGNN